MNAAGSINSRYLSISKAVPYYPYLGVVFGGISLFFFIQIGLEILTTLSLPLIVSLLYVIPFLPHGKRLRDISYLKIFLIALTWTWFSVWYLIGDIENNLLMLITLEHFIFMLGITLPFDVRDIKIDQADNVSTFATLLGKSNAKITTTLLLTISLILTLLILYTLGSVWLPYLLYSLLYIGMIVLVNINVLYQRDVYLTGVLDGTILLKGLIGWLFVI